MSFSASLGFRQARELGVKSQDLAGSEPWLVTEHLRQVADLPARARVAERCSEHETLSRVGPRKADQQLYQRCFTCPVWPQQAHHFAGTDAE